MIEPRWRCANPWKLLLKDDMLSAEEEEEDGHREILGLGAH